MQIQTKLEREERGVRVWSSRGGVRLHIILLSFALQAGVNAFSVSESLIGRNNAETTYASPRSRNRKEWNLVTHEKDATVLRLGSSGDERSYNDERRDNEEKGLDDHGASNKGESERLKRQAEALRDEIRSMEAKLGDARSRRDVFSLSNRLPLKVDNNNAPQFGSLSLRNKRVLVVGANGRVGSMVCRYLLRNHPETEVIAAVHYVGESSTRGYGRLSHEVGAEDGVGKIGPAWNFEDRNAYFEYTTEMKSYNLQNLRVVEVELLDPVQCTTITEDVDSVIWCATDFNGNKPRAISGLNVAFLFRAVADPTKGRVEVEGLRNILGGLKNGKQLRTWKDRDMMASVSRSDGSGMDELHDSESNQPISFVLISASPDAFNDFETPSGSFKALKKEGEQILVQEYPSISHCILQMSRYDDNFVNESLPISVQDDQSGKESSSSKTEAAQEELTEGVCTEERSRRRINRRDAARAAVDALTDTTLIGKKVKVWTARR